MFFLCSFVFVYCFCLFLFVFCFCFIFLFVCVMSSWCLDLWLLRFFFVCVSLFSIWHVYCYLIYIWSYREVIISTANLEKVEIDLIFNLCSLLQTFVARFFYYFRAITFIVFPTCSTCFLFSFSNAITW